MEAPPAAQGFTPRAGHQPQYGGRLKGRPPGVNQAGGCGRSRSRLGDANLPADAREAVRQVVAEAEPELRAELVRLMGVDPTLND